MVSSECTPIRFPAWKEALAAEPLPEAVRASYRRGILAFLHHCKVRRASATAMLAKEYLVGTKTQDANEIREALRWFFAPRSDARLVHRDPHQPRTRRGRTLPYADRPRPTPRVRGRWCRPPRSPIRAARTRNAISSRPVGPRRSYGAPRKRIVAGRGALWAFWEENRLTRPTPATRPRF